MAEETKESALSPVSSAYRTAAGLPPRENDQRTDLLDGPSLEKQYEPEGGYGGKEGANTAATNATEQANLEQRDAQAQQRAEQLEETGLTGGEPATQEAIVTGEDVEDVKPEPGHTPENDVVTEGTTEEE